MNAKLHNWNLTPEEAARVQTELRERLVLTWDERPVATIGGVDVSIKTETARAAIVVLRYPELTPLEAVTADAPLVFPYIPGLLSFREGPPFWQPGTNYKTSLTCSCSMDRVSLIHAGLASPPKWGCGWSAQPSAWQNPACTDGMQRWAADAATGQTCSTKTGNVIGTVLRTREKTNPLYISPGHLIDVEHAVEFVHGLQRRVSSARAHSLGA